MPLMTNVETWWETLLLNSRELSHGTVLTAGSVPCLSEASVASVLQRLGSIERKQNRIRVFVDGSLSYRLEQKIRDNPPNAEQDLERWSQEIFGNSECCVVLNNAEKYFEPLTQGLAKFLKPLVDRCGLPSGGFDIVLILGRYAWTPFGVHTDGPGDVTLHFNVSTATKDMCIWREDDYRSLRGSMEPTFQFESLLASATKLSFGPEEALFLPASFHVGSSPCFSVDIAVGIKTAQAGEFFDDLVQARARELVDPYRLGSEPAYSLSAQRFHRFASVGLNPLHRAITLGQWADEIYEEHWLALASNAGFEAPPLPTTEQFDQIEYYHVPHCFPIMRSALAPSNVIRLYARKHRLELPRTEGTERLVALLLSGDSLKVDTLRTRSGIDATSIAGLMNQLFEINAIQRVDPATSAR
jgi:hypothetical protein